MNHAIGELEALDLAKSAASLSKARTLLESSRPSITLQVLCGIVLAGALSFATSLAVPATIKVVLAAALASSIISIFGFVFIRQRLEAAIVLLRSLERPRV